jgi:hypothetical protein
MQNDFTIITPTGDRPKAFTLCKLYVERQTILPKEWIIVDDGIDPILPISLPFIKYVRRIPQKDDPKHTLPVQMLEAFKHVTTDKVIIMEDDDWYSKEYCKIYTEMLLKADLAGHSNIICYKITEARYSFRQNTTWSNWGATGFNRNTMLCIEKVLQRNRNDVLFDSHFWSTHRNDCKKILYTGTVPICVGIKGMGGRSGIGIGHGDTPGFIKDTNYTLLKSIIKEDIKNYFDWRTE